MLEVLNRRALAEKFRVGHDRAFGARTRLADQALDLIAGADRYGRFGHHHGEAIERGCDLFCRGVNVGQVGVAVAAARWRANRDEHRVRRGHRSLQLGRKTQASGLHVGSHQIFEAGFIDRHFAALERRDLAGVLVDADDVVAEIGKASPRNEADVTGADHCDAHEVRNMVKESGPHGRTARLSRDRSG